MDSSNFSDSSVRSLWRYSRLLPVSKKENITSLGEGWTPLIRSRNLASKLTLSDLHLKNEGVNPSFSFKDREVSLAFSMATELGLVPIAMASSGNAGSALSAYSARSGMKSFVLTPEYTPNEKTLQMSIYGANVLKIRGTIEECRALVEDGKRRFGWTPFNTSILRSFAIEGTKTIAFEIYEQLGRAPNTIIVPTGSGRGCLSIWKGFSELQGLGIIANMPKFVSVQPASLHPIANAINGRVEPVAEGRSLATALLVQNPPELELVARAVKSSGGSAIVVNDSEILAAQSLLARQEGVFAEPSSASSIAALLKLSQIGQLGKDETIVCVITGSGLKDTGSALKAVSPVPIVDPELNALAPFVERWALG